jgi:transposase
MSTKGYPSDSTDQEWAFVAPYLTLITQEAPQRKHDLRRVYDALKYVIRSGVPWRMLPHDFPPWAAVYQQARRWLDAGVFEMMTHDLREIMRYGQARKKTPTGVILDARVLKSSVESGHRAAWDGHRRMKGSKIHIAVDTLGNLLAAVVTSANENERKQVAELAKRVQDLTGETVQVAWVDQGYSGEDAEAAAAEHGIDLLVVKHAEAKRGFVLLPRRWVVERSFVWMARCRRLVRDYERLPGVLVGLHFVAFAMLLLNRLGPQVHNTF